MFQTHADTPKPGLMLAQPVLTGLPAAFGAVPGRIGLGALRLTGTGRRRAIWSAVHLVGAGLFVLAMISRMAPTDTIPDLAISPAVAGTEIFPNTERPLPSAPHMN
ncbi:MAG: hypothetical protein RLZZ491_651 [Pseudomonadota bacterium]